jgi:hypothetical protein
LPDNGGSAAPFAVSLRAGKGRIFQICNGQRGYPAQSGYHYREGEQGCSTSKQIFEATDQRVFEGFTEEEKAKLSCLLQKLNANLDRMEEEIKQKKERT